MQTEPIADAATCPFCQAVLENQLRWRGRRFALCLALAFVAGLVLGVRLE